MTLSDQMVEAAARALSDISDMGWQTASEYQRDAWREQARAALAAVAPAIEAAALERAAVVAEQLPSPDFIYDWPDAIAAAIRALKETT